MKTYFIHFLFLLTSHILTFALAFSQQGPVHETSEHRTYCEMFDDLFQFKLSDVPLNYVYDRVYPKANLENLKPCDTINTARITQGWWELEHSNIENDRTITYHQRREKLRVSTLSNNIPIMFFI